MELMRLMEKLSQEKRQYQNSQIDSGRCRYYILNQLYSIVFSYSSIPTSVNIVDVLYTLGQLRLESGHLLPQVLRQVRFPKEGNALFKVPGLRLKYSDDPNTDVVTEVILKLVEELGTWQSELTADEIIEKPFYKEWLGEMTDPSRKNAKQITLGGRVLKEQAQLEATLQDYIQKADLSPDAKVEAFRYIQKVGDYFAASLVNKYLSEIFKDFDQWEDKKFKSNWGLDEYKQIVCRSMFAITFPQQESPEDVEKPKVHHDEALIKGFEQQEKKPDIVASGKVHLVYEGGSIQPKPDNFTIIGDSVSVFPLLVKKGLRNRRP